MRFWSVLIGMMAGIGIARFLGYDRDWHTSEPLRTLMVLFGILGAGVGFVFPEWTASERKK